MSGFFQQFLGGVAQGFLENPNLRTAQHGTKVFTADGYANAPKLKFLFHVYFEINKDLLTNDRSAFPDDVIPGLLVKNVTLPKYTMSLAEMNQYNRPRYIQTKIKYDPVTISFHDDNKGAIKQMWYNYYSYYYNDNTTAARQQNAGTINTRNTYSPDVNAQQNWGYLGEPSTSATAAATSQPKPQFFKSIKIYGFNQHNFSLYTLVNPIIERFDHDTYDYAQATGTMENKMTVRYETVTYAEGAVNGQAPDKVVSGFGTEQYYDKTLSPVNRPGTNATIMGQGGLVDAADGILSDLSSGNFLGALKTATNTAQTVKNAGGLGNIVKNEAKSAILATAANPRTLFNFASSGSGTNATNNTPSTQAPRTTDTR
jgi:hypothetical protein